MSERNFHVALAKAGISQIELAAKIGLHPSTLSRIACGWLIPDEKTQKAIMNALGPLGRDIKFGYRLGETDQAEK